MKTYKLIVYLPYGNPVIETSTSFMCLYNLAKEYARFNYKCVLGELK